MSREEALYWLDTIPTIGEQVDALEMAIQALSQEPTKEEQALLQKWRDNRGISIGEFEDAMNALQEPCDDAINRILKRMWNCRGKHTTSIDKVAMEQIIRDELPPVTQKSGKWLYIREDKYTCSKCGTITRVDEGGIDEKPMYKFCPYCGARMVEPQESEEQTE